METLGEATMNCAFSIFEAKGGLRPALLTCENDQAFDKVALAPLVKKAGKLVKDAIKKGNAAVIQPLEGGKGCLKNCEELLCLCVGMDLRTKSALPKASWAEKIYQTQYLGTDESYANVGFSAFGMLNAVLVLEGDIAFMGIPYDAVDGASFKEKRTQLSRCTVDNFKTLITTKGGSSAASRTPAPRTAAASWSCLAASSSSQRA
jgi:hypothetical protein